MIIQPLGHDMQPKKNPTAQGEGIIGEAVTGFIYCLRKYSYNKWVQTSLFFSPLFILLTEKEYVVL